MDISVLLWCVRFLFVRAADFILVFMWRDIRVKWADDFIEPFAAIKDMSAWHQHESWVV
jgi:hypothetical protein